MKTYNIHDAKTNLSKIINEVAEGEIVYIARAGKRIVELKPIQDEDQSFKMGFLKNKMSVAEDWDSDQINEKVAASFYQEDMNDPDSPYEINERTHPKYKKEK
ncbi:MAG: type II toxin-antitoxin system Phd/YefM family antitoxin [Cyclobacteriaceae bacterium]